MKKEFSFYEFVGLLVPSCIFLVGGYYLLHRYATVPRVDFSSFSETTVFLIVCYGVGHILQSLGNIFEQILWWIYRGKPTEWLTVQNRFGALLFAPTLRTAIIEKLKTTFGDHDEYGAMVYNKLCQENKCARIDIFNANYSLFRGLSVCFLLLALGVTYFSTWQFALAAYIPFLLTVRRMIRFARHYATETFLTFFNS